MFHRITVGLKGGILRVLVFLAKPKQSVITFALRLRCKLEKERPWSTFEKV
jgi:hypothetical protein